MGSLHAPTSPLVQQLEEEYRAKVVELESKMATAQLQVFVLICLRVTKRLSLSKAHLAAWT